MHKKSIYFLSICNICSRQPNPVGLSHGRILKNQSSRDNVYAIIFDESEEGYVEVSPDCYKLGLIRKILPGSPK